MNLIENIYSCEIINWYPVIARGGRTMFIKRPFPYNLRYAFFDYSKIIFCRNDSYDFYSYSFTDNAGKQFFNDHKGIEISNEDKNNYFKSMEKKIDPTFVRMKDIKNKAPFPDEKPPFEWIFADDTGFMIFVSHDEDELNGTGCDLFDSNGNFIKKIYIRGIKKLGYQNDRINLKFKNGEIYATLVTEEGYSKAVRYNLVTIED